MARRKTTPQDPRLVLNAAEDILQLALVNEGQILGVQELAVGGQAMPHLAPGLQSLLDRFGLAACDLKGVACVRGPGSFTGLRVTLAMGLGLARAANAPMAGLDYLPLLAAGPASLLEGTLAVLTYARASQIYLQCFDCPDANPLSAPTPLGCEDAAKAISKLKGQITVMGSGLRRNADFFTNALSGVSRLDEQFDRPMPMVLARAAQAAHWSQDPIAPLYLRASDAEDNLPAIAQSRGMDEDDAQKRLEKALTSLTSPDCSNAQ